MGFGFVVFVDGEVVGEEMECGGIDSGVLPVDRHENEVETEDSRDRSCRTSISSLIRRFRFRDGGGG